METGSGLKRKICCISVMTNWGGGEEFLVRLHENLSDYNFIVISPEGEAKKRFEKAGIRTITNNHQKKVYRNSGWNLVSFLKIISGIIYSTFRLSGLFKDENPVLILANGLFAALYLLPAAILSGRRFIVIQHLIFNENSIEKTITKLVFRSAEKIVCVSNSVKENILEMLDRSDSDRITVIPNGIQIEPVTNSPAREKRTVKIGMVGSITRIKGIDLVLRALKDVQNKEMMTLHIYGDPTAEDDSVEYKHEIEILVKDPGLRDKVKFEGFVLSKQDIYSSIDILINYSIIPESFSFSVLEAMAYKKIVIAVGSGGPKEIIADGESGFLVNPGDLNQLKEKIEFCLENIGSESFNQIREKAYERVKNYYSIEKFAENYNNLFNSLIK